MSTERDVKNRLRELGFDPGQTEVELFEAILAALWSLELLKNEVIRHHVEQV